MPHGHSGPLSPTPKETGDPPIAPAEVNRHFVLAKCDFFVNAQLWPIGRRLNPTSWLENFTAAELDHAVALLNAFLFLPTGMTRQLFAAAFHGLSREVIPQDTQDPLSAWNTFLGNVLVTRVTGEAPSDTDSGYLFARWSRQELRLAEHQIVSNSAALELLEERPGHTVVFVDDFVGSGEQMIHTWHRQHLVRGMERAFADYSGDPTNRFYYTPVLCTEYGARRVNASCSGLQLRPTHSLPQRYSALHRRSILWPRNLLATAAEFVRTASKRAGVPEADYAGFHGLGLAIAFAHSVPDATLPIFYWSCNDWRPLLERT